MVAPPVTFGVALTVTFDPTPNVAVLVGLVRVIVGPKPVTVTVTNDDVATFAEPELSTAVALKEYVPVAVGNHVIEWGPNGPVTVPIEVPLTEKLTDVRIVPPGLVPIPLVA